MGYDLFRSVVYVQVASVDDLLHRSRVVIDNDYKTCRFWPIAIDEWVTLKRHDGTGPFISERTHDILELNAIYSTS